MAINLADFSKRLAAVVASIGQESLPDHLMVFLKKQVDIDNAVILFYHREQPPKVTYNDLPSINRSTHITLFLKGAYLLDPCYRAAREGFNGYYQLDQLAPAGFRKSEYYKNYFRYTGLIDECGYIFKLGPDNFLNVSLGRDESSQRFNLSQQRLLKELTPLIKEICLTHWRTQDFYAQKDTHGHIGHSEDSLHTQLESALKSFSTSILTDRESQVIQLFLHGHSTKSIAEKLGISPETVKLHRKNSYAKLDVRSQAELFFLFIDALSSMDNYTGGDPLTGYLNHEK
ncbi:MAG TPA: LuxR family transcriptional regulator [Porticoccus sp.]|nr:LuxR family transcriptional regulator [Porticoccus sp.]